MTALESADAAGWLCQQATEGSPDVLRTLVTTFANALMSAEADTVCGAEYGHRSEDRTNRRNGYRAREWDTRGHRRVGDPESAAGFVLPGLVVGASPAGGAGPGHRGGHLLPAGGLHPAG